MKNRRSFVQGAWLIPPVGSDCGRLWVAIVGDCGYKISAYERTATARRPSVKSPLSQPSAKKDEIFASKPPEGGGIPMMAWVVAGLAVLVVVAVLAVMGRNRTATPTTVQPLAPYAASLPLSQLAMSESTSLSGGKSTFIDGHIQNTGGQTVSGITVQVIFRNDEAMPPQIETLPLSLIRTREPYVDTQSVGSAPLKPGDGRDFRLIFESIPANWNMQMPEIRIIQVDAK